MAPIKQVKSLYLTCLDEVLKYVHGLILKNPGEFSSLRKYLITVLHGIIREQLIERAVSAYSSNVFDVLDIIELLADPKIRKLQLKKDGEFLTGFQSGQLYTRIDGSDVIGLHELHVKVQPDPSNGGPHVEHVSSVLLHNTLSRGLAQTLRVLTLHNAADNQTLKILGQYAHHLTHLDITASWLVDDFGIGELLLKDAGRVLKSQFMTDLENYDPAAVEAVGSLCPEDINRTCSTLTEVRIQDTNTNVVSLLLLLILTKNLKTLGGFLYYSVYVVYPRNMGDAVVCVQARRDAPAHLQLRELWETQLLPRDKLVKVARYLPHLTSLYTRALHLPSCPGLIPPLTALTADFDFVQCAPSLYTYLQPCGATIRKLTLCDQVQGVDLSVVGSLCPCLEELKAKVMVVEPEAMLSRGAMSKLTTARLRISHTSTFRWIMRHASTIKYLQLALEKEECSDMFEDDVIWKMIEENPPSLQTIEYLNIHMFHNTGFQNFVVSCGTLSIEAGYALLTACNNIRFLGDMHTWFKVSHEDVIEMAKYIKENNLDVKINFRDIIYPSGSSIQ